MEEADETMLWLELLGEADIIPPHRLQSLLEDDNQIVAILATARKAKKVS